MDRIPIQEFCFRNITNCQTISSAKSEFFFRNTFPNILNGGNGNTVYLFDFSQVARISSDASKMLCVAFAQITIRPWVKYACIKNLHVGTAFDLEDLFAKNGIVCNRIETNGSYTLFGATKAVRKDAKKIWKFLTQIKDWKFADGVHKGIESPKSFQQTVLCLGMLFNKRLIERRDDNGLFEYRALYIPERFRQ